MKSKKRKKKKVKRKKQNDIKNKKCWLKDK